MFLNVHIFVVFPDFFSWLTSSFIMLWSENTHSVISIFWYLLRTDLWPSMWSFLENILCVLKKYVHYAALGWNVLNISHKSIWPSMFQSHSFLFDFLLRYLSIMVSGVLKFLTITILLSMSFFMFVIDWLIYLGAPKLGA